MVLSVPVNASPEDIIAKVDSMSNVFLYAVADAMNITRDSCVGFLLRLPNCTEVTLEHRQRNAARRLTVAQARRLADFEGSVGVPCKPRSDKIQLVAIMDVAGIVEQLMPQADPGSAVSLGISRLEDVFNTEDKYQEIFSGFVDQWVVAANVSSVGTVLDLQYTTVKAHPKTATDNGTPSQLYHLFLLLLLPCVFACAGERVTPTYKMPKSRLQLPASQLQTLSRTM
jgi:hypothetical protein